MNSHASLLRKHWHIIFAATAGWALDAFDFTILLFLIPHLGKVFNVGLPQMALVVTATGFAKIAGTIGWGFAADRYGRKLAFMAAVLWFSCASGLSGLAWSYASLMAMRVLFGMGFGGDIQDHIRSKHRNQLGEGQQKLGQSQFPHGSRFALR